MSDKSIKTHFSRNVFLTFIVLLLVGIGMLSFKLNREVDCSGIDFEIIANSYTTESLIEFKSNSPEGVEWEWKFGDRSLPMYRSNVLHQFKAAGTYLVSLEVNGVCTTTKEIVIAEPKILIDPQLIPQINFPKTIRVGEEVTFSNASSFARSWQWSFGETTRVDGRDQETKYTFSEAGEKTVLLVVNDDRLHAAKQRITVLPPRKEERRRPRPTKRVDPIETVLREQIDQIPDKPPVAEDKTEAVERIEVSEVEMRQMLLLYSNRNIDDREIRSYFCYSSIPVFNKSGERKTVNQLFKDIRDVSKIDLKELRLNRDKTTGCITSMTLNLRTKNGIFWKNF